MKLKPALALQDMKELQQAAIPVRSMRQRKLLASHVCVRYSLPQSIVACKKREMAQSSYQQISLSLFAADSPKSQALISFP